MTKTLPVIIAALVALALAACEGDRSGCDRLEDTNCDGLFNLADGYWCDACETRCERPSPMPGEAPREVLDCILDGEAIDELTDSTFAGFYCSTSRDAADHAGLEVRCAAIGAVPRCERVSGEPRPTDLERPTCRTYIDYGAN